jgi:lipoprotein-releasing system permease protein
LNIPLFLSKKLIPKDSKQISKPIVLISISTVALGVSILILAFAVTTGFKNEIQDKIIGFGSPIEIGHFDNNHSYESMSIVNNLACYTEIKEVKNVANLQSIVTKAGIIKGERDIEGVLFKGIGKDYNRHFFEKHIQKGRFIRLSDSAASGEIIISELLANKLQLDTAMRIVTYFVQNPVRQRVFTITGIYNTGLENYDRNMVICDRRTLQKLNNWNENQVSGIEIQIKDFAKIESTNQQINDLLPPDMVARTIIERHRDIFDWVDLFNQNVYILIILIVIVCSVSLISTQLTILLEHITTIGILKTLGCTHGVIRNVFLCISARILGWGLLAGNVVALLLCYLQSRFTIIHLNPENYYVSSVPIQVEGLHMLIINVGVIGLSLGILIIPAWFVSKKTKAIDALQMD